MYIGSKKDLRKKVVTEVEEIQEIVHQYHSNPMGGQSGINNTLSKISQFYMWNGMKNDVVEYVNIKQKLVNSLYEPWSEIVFVMTTLKVVWFAAW